MRTAKSKLGWSAARRWAVAVGVAYVFTGVSPARTQAAAWSQEPGSTSRLLSAEEGRAIVNAAREQDQPARGAQDCSHFVHQIYLSAGFEYPYASSYDIYAGNENFERVRTPQVGDLIAWPGHVGIVVDPMQYSFYSLVSIGLVAQDYEGPYWRSRGRPRFYRYKVENPEGLTAAKAAASTRAPKIPRRHSAPSIIEERSPRESATSNRPSKATSERTPVFFGPLLPATPDATAATTVAATTFEVPPSIIIAAGNKQPTREEVAEGISEWSNAAGNVLRTGDLSKLQMPVVIFERLNVERVEIKRDHGWARLQIDSRLSIAGRGTDFKPRREKVRWELRRTESGWEAVRPPDRTYVPHDVAVRNLAGQLARLTESDGASQHPDAILRQESQLANLLSVLLENK